MTVQISPSPSEALAIAETVFRSRYAGASFAYVAGSIMRGQGTRLSDIDLVVIYDRLEAARRESFVADGVPVEAFVHDAETLAWFVDADVSRGRPSILNMIVEGTVIGGFLDRAEILRRDVSERLSAGPPALKPAELNALRYEITDAIDDLRGERSWREVMAIGAMLHPKLVELALRGRSQWNGTGKWASLLLSSLRGAARRRGKPGVWHSRRYGCPGLPHRQAAARNDDRGRVSVFAGRCYAVTIL